MNSPFSIMSLGFLLGSIMSGAFFMGWLNGKFLLGGGARPKRRDENADAAETDRPTQRSATSEVRREAPSIPAAPLPFVSMSPPGTHAASSSRPVQAERSIVMPKSGPQPKVRRDPAPAPSRQAAGEPMKPEARAEPMRSRASAAKAVEPETAPDLVAEAIAPKPAAKSLDRESAEPKQKVPAKPAAKVVRAESVVVPEPAARPAASKRMAERPTRKKAGPPPPPDDLVALRGVGATLAAKLTKMEITRFAQIAAWTEGDVARIDKALNLRGRIRRERWIEQAKALADPKRSRPKARKSASAAAAAKSAPAVKNKKPSRVG